MGKMVLILVISVLLIGGGYYLLTQKTPSYTTNVLTVAPTRSPEVIVTSTKSISLVEQNVSKESGMATLAEKNGKVEVTLSLTGAPVGVVQPAHIHTGSCTDIGGVVYPLTSPVDGKSVTTLDVTFSQLKDQLPLALNVHKSGPEASTYVACGDLSF